MTKKKSNRQKRTLVGAICVAAVIMAGSTFAWFTSTDEVTNRLSASADYNVSLVESFSPPENWIPGQEINKDVYAVNTGNIAAFVKETVSGVMTITRETKVASASFDTEKANLTKLTVAERYVMEAGSYLAYAPNTTANPLGQKIVAMIPDTSDLDGYTTADVLTDFAPAENGLYVFRRSIGVAADRTETFEYVGYYYDNGDFYKVELESVTPDNVVDVAGDTEKADGNLTAATYSLFKDVTTKETPTLTYDATNHKLVATVTGSGLNVTDAQTALTDAGAAYDTAAHNYQEALAKQTVAVREDTAASDNEKSTLSELNNAKATEAAAKLAYDKKVAEYNNKKALYDTANGNLTTATTTVNSVLSALYGSDTGTPDSPPASPTGGLYKTYKDAEAAKAAAPPTDQEAFRVELRDWANQATGLNKGFANDATIETMVAALSSTELATFNATEQHSQYAADAACLVAKKNYDDKVAEYNAANAEVTRLTTETSALKSEYEAALTALYGNTTNTPTNEPAASTQAEVTALSDGLYKTWKQAVLNTATMQTAYDTAKGSNTTASSARATADANVAQTKAALDAAKKAYEDAQKALAGTGDIKINIFLQNDVTAGGTADKWQILPTTVTNNEAEFYYTSILDKGETSTQLIDKVVLDASVTQDMYKSFDFDLNVALDSVQITYDTDQETILATGATEQFGKTATLTDAKNINTAISWS